MSLAAMFLAYGNFAISVLGTGTHCAATGDGDNWMLQRDLVYKIGINTPYTITVPRSIPSAPGSLPLTHGWLSALLQSVGGIVGDVGSLILLKAQSQ